MNKALEVLNERAKELQCVYEVEELLLQRDLLLPEVLAKLLRIIPRGWQFPTVCEVCITYQGKDYNTRGYKETDWWQSSDIIIDNNIVGHIKVVYTQFIRDFGGSQFLPEEQRLLNNISNRLGNYIFHKKLEQTLPLLSRSGSAAGLDFTELQPDILSGTSDEHWKWRFRIAERIAAEMDMERFGAEAVYLIGSTLDGNAGQGSDIDLIVLVNDDAQSQALLRTWMEGWSLCLTELNYLKTGYRSQVGLIDLHLVTAKDIKDKDSYAVMIGSSSGASHCLRKK
jgi:hypothetical protein